LKPFLRISCILLICVFSNGCKTSGNKALVTKSPKVYSQQTDSLPLIPKYFLELETNSAGYCLVRGKSNRKVVALTFDDGPTNLSNKILDVLNKNSVKATFFWQGSNLAGNSDIIEKAKKNKHQIANHSWDHTNGYNLDENVVWEQQVAKTNSALKTVAGVQSKYYRPPFGGITHKQIDFLGSKDITTVLWSLTTMDWDPTQNDSIDLENKFKNYLHPGAIVLMHDQDFGKSEEMLVALEKMILYGKSQGYKFVTIEKIK
jgi:peptidoglycan/xylan/chitin deacetylase (PgdA/CDA1 family)